MNAVPDGIPVRRVRWKRSVRIVPSRFPPVGVFDRVADPDDLEAVFAVEGYTNERLRDEIGELALVPPAERIAGPGTTPVMASFTHPRPSRFSDGSCGVYYCARRARSAIRETVYHRERFLRDGGFGPMDIEMREYIAPIDARLHDLRGQQENRPDVYSPQDYTAGQRLGRDLRAAGSWGVAFTSVRDADGGACAGLFRPRAVVGPCVQGRHLVYRWDGDAIAHVFEVTEVGQ